MSLRSSTYVMRNSFLVMTLWIQEEIATTAFIFVGFFLRAQTSRNPLMILMIPSILEAFKMICDVESVCVMEIKAKI